MPLAALVSGSNGALYGSTVGGGSHDRGTVFKLKPDGSGYTILKDFIGGDGINPEAALVTDSNGVLYGTAAGGQGTDRGTVFKLNADGGGYTVLHNFTGTDGDGDTPRAALVLDSDGVLYGTTEDGGTGGSGTVFRLQPDGSGYTVLKNFAFYSFDDKGPRTDLVFGSDGALYGTTLYGGGLNAGTLFKLNPDGSGYEELTNFTFSLASQEMPGATLVSGAGGVFYGTTFHGGSHNAGTVFRLNPDGSGYTELYSFTGTGGDGWRERLHGAT
jgi:uncharacterized repeat protein (TIGR03803 family)